MVHGSKHKSMILLTNNNKDTHCKIIQLISITLHLSSTLRSLNFFEPITLTSTPTRSPSRCHSHPHSRSRWLPWSPLLLPLPPPSPHHLSPLLFPNSEHNNLPSSKRLTTRPTHVLEPSISKKHCEVKLCYDTLHPLQRHLLGEISAA